MPADLTLAEIEELKELAGKASPGPWAYEGVSEKSNDFRVGIARPVDADGDVGEPISGDVHNHPHYFNDETNEFGEWYCETVALIDDEDHTPDGACSIDASFIAASRSAVPALCDTAINALARVKELEAENRRLREALEPFAQLGSRLPAYIPDSALIVITTVGGGAVSVTSHVQASDLRRASTALEQS